MRILEKWLGDSLVPVAIMAICVAGLLVAGQLGPDGQATRPVARHAATGPTTIAAPGIADWRKRMALSWQPHATPEHVLTRIGLGSCLGQTQPQPIWRSVIAARPELFVMMGDNVYGDVKSPDLRELVRAYTDLAAHDDFSAARAAMPFLATWDDHDYGLNDGGGDFEAREGAQVLFEHFWKGSGTREGNLGPGISYARSFGPEGSRVQLILLDTRSFRSALKRKPKGAPGRGKYEPDSSPQKTLLGAQQWAWLADRLYEPADLRIIVSSIQVIADGHGFERWGNLPAEREKLYRLIAETKANGVVLASGDRHRAAFYRYPNASYPLYELTSSSLNRAFDDPTEKGPYQLETMYGEANFGMIEIDWKTRSVRMTIRGPSGDTVRKQLVKLDDLQHPAN